MSADTPRAQPTKIRESENPGRPMDSHVDASANPPPLGGGGIGRHIARGAAWMIAMRWLMRCIGLISTIIVARILSPDDYGVLAMSALVVEFLMTLGDPNIDIALLRDQKASRESYDSAWTVQVLFGLAVSCCLVGLAPVLAAYYREPRVETAMYILALRPAILGFQNVGIVDFRKTLNFARDFQFGVVHRLSLLGFTLVLALTLRSYLALAIAAPLSAAISVILSFVMSKYRPRFCFTKFRSVWGSSRWFILQSVSQSAIDGSDEFIIGGVGNSVDVGTYYIAAQAAPMPTRELAWPLERALMPTYAKIADDPAELRNAIKSVLGLVALVCFPVGFGMSAVAGSFVLAVFGEKWRASIVFFEWLAIFGAFAAMTRTWMAVYYNLGRERLFALLTAGQLVVGVPFLIAAAQHGNLVAIAAIRTAVAAVFFLLISWLGMRGCQMRRMDLWQVMWRPATAALIMWLTLVNMPAFAGWPVFQLARDIAVGGAVFCAAQVLLWFSAGRPQGAERTLIALVRRVDRSQRAD